MGAISSHLGVSIELMNVITVPRLWLCHNLGTVTTHTLSTVLSLSPLLQENSIANQSADYAALMLNHWSGITPIIIDAALTA